MLFCAVDSITNGYEFIFYSTNGEKESSFSINAKIAETPSTATGYKGKEGMAIENFRAWLNRYKS